MQAQTAEHLRARKQYEQGQLPAALATVRSLLKRNRYDGRAWELAGLIHYAGGNFPQAVSSLETASTLVPLKATGRACLAHAYRRIGKPDLAREVLMLCVGDSSASVSVLLQVARELDDLDRPELAMHACRAALKRDDRSAQAHYDLSVYARRCGHPAEMSEVLARIAIDLDPDDATFRLGLAGFLFEGGRRDEALDLVKTFSNEEIRATCCTCCLERLAAIYESGNDYRRANVCRVQLIHAEARRSDPPSH